jgi:hypothetical protein
VNAGLAAIRPPQLAASLTFAPMPAGRFLLGSLRRSSIFAAVKAHSFSPNVIKSPSFLAGSGRL